MPKNLPGLLLGVLLLVFCGLVPQAWAGAPVVDLSIDGASSSDQAMEQEQASNQPAGQLSIEAVPPVTLGAQKKIAPKLPALEEEGGMGDANDSVRLKQQLTNYVRMNLPGKIETLQQEVAELRGQLEVQAHELKAIKEQQQQYDQDIEHRLAQSKSSTVNIAKTPAIPVADKGVNEQKEQQAYNKAFNLIKEKKYSQAINGLKGFLKEYPGKEGENSKYALNAYYWLGELYFLQGQFEPAAEQFKTVVKKFPGKPKVPDAMFKLGLISGQSGKKAEAKQMFQDIKKRFPDSAAAHSAVLELQKL